VYSAAQMFSGLGPIFSTVVSLTLTYQDQEDTLSSESHNEANHAHWREVLRSFYNAETLCVHEDLVKELAGSLQVQDGTSPTALLPELKELQYYDRVGIHDAFVPFLDARRNVGRPFQLTPLARHPSLGPGPFDPIPRSLMSPLLEELEI
jgi:hypothetical protein